MRDDVNETDWQLFKERIGQWQENFMERLNSEYARILADERITASEKFWKIEKRINADKSKYGVICRRSRSTLLGNMIRLYGEGAITDNDLDGFSEELVKSVKAMNKPL